MQVFAIWFDLFRTSVVYSFAAQGLMRPEPFNCISETTLLKRNVSDVWMPLGEKIHSHDLILKKSIEKNNKKTLLRVRPGPTA